MQFDDSFKPKLVAPPAQKETQVKAKVNKKDTPEWLQKRQMSSATYQIRKQVRVAASKRSERSLMFVCLLVCLVLLVCFGFRCNGEPGTTFDQLRRWYVL